MKLLYPKVQIKMDLYNDRLNSLVMEHTEIFEKIASAAMYAKGSTVTSFPNFAPSQI